MSQTVVDRQEIPQWKQDTIKKLEEDFMKYSVVAAVDLTKVRSSMLHEIRRRLRDRVKMIVIKKTLVRKTMEKLQKEKPNLTKLIDSIKGGVLLLFTDVDPFKLSLLIERNKVRVSAKGGDTADSEIIVPAGNTGIPPGPVISEFGESKIPTKIDSGTIWISTDTVVAEKGDVIPLNLASLLSRLGVKPIEAGLSLLCSYSDGIIVSGEDLILDLEQYKIQLIDASSKALNLAVNAGIPTKDSLPLILVKAFQEAKRLSIEAEYPETDILQESLREAHRRASTLSSKVAA
jgi:large subunit ribosomal protein L10